MSLSQRTKKGRKTLLRIHKTVHDKEDKKINDFLWIYVYWSLDYNFILSAKAYYCNIKINRNYNCTWEMQKDVTNVKVEFVAQVYFRESVRLPTAIESNNICKNKFVLSCLALFFIQEIIIYDNTYLPTSCFWTKIGLLQITSCFKGLSLSLRLLSLIRFNFSSFSFVWVFESFKNGPVPGSFFLY